MVATIFRHAGWQQRLARCLVALYVAWWSLVAIGSVVASWQQRQLHVVMTVAADEVAVVVHHHDHSGNYQHLANHPEQHSSQSGDHDHAIQLAFKPLPYQPLGDLALPFFFLCSWLLPLAPRRLLPVMAAPPFLQRLSPHGQQATIRLLI